MSWANDPDMTAFRAVICGTPMSHPDGSVSPCMLPKDHYITIEDSDHYDVHGCRAPVLVRQSTIREIQRIQELRESGEIQ